MMPDEPIFIPTANAMTFSTLTFVSTSRTTSCDIMCTSNTESERRVTQKHGPSTVMALSASASFPYQSMDTIVRFKGSTLVEKYRYATSQEKRNESLKRERNIFFTKMEKERIETSKRRTDAASKIQAHFRGYVVRRPPIHPRQRFENGPHFSIVDLQEELCSLAEILELKPIPGLSLETRGKRSRRRARIELAAVIRVQTCVRKFLAIINRDKIRNKLLRKRLDRAATSIQKFFKWVMKQRSLGELLTSMRHRSIIKIQTRLRMFLAKERVRRMMAFQQERKRQIEAANSITCFLKRKEVEKRIASRKKLSSSGSI
eukprot:gene11593-24267_t